MGDRVRDFDLGSRSSIYKSVGSNYLVKLHNPSLRETQLGFNYPPYFLVNPNRSSGSSKNRTITMMEPSHTIFPTGPDITITQVRMDPPNPVGAVQNFHSSISILDILINEQNNLATVVIVEKKVKRLSSTDLKLVCKGGHIWVHRAVLANCSPFIKALLGTISEEHVNDDEFTIYLDDYDVESVRKVCSLFYTGETLVDEIRDYAEILETAELFGIAQSAINLTPISKEDGKNIKSVVVLNNETSETPPSVIPDPTQPVSKATNTPNDVPSQKPGTSRDTVFKVPPTPVPKPKSSKNIENGPSPSFAKVTYRLPPIPNVTDNQQKSPTTGANVPNKELEAAALRAFQEDLPLDLPPIPVTEINGQENVVLVSENRNPSAQSAVRKKTTTEPSTSQKQLLSSTTASENSGRGTGLLRENIRTDRPGVPNRAVRKPRTKTYRPRSKPREQPEARKRKFSGKTSGKSRSPPKRRKIETRNTTASARASTSTTPPGTRATQRLSSGEGGTEAERARAGGITEVESLRLAQNIALEVAKEKKKSNPNPKLDCPYCPSSAGYQTQHELTLHITTCPNAQRIWDKYNMDQKKCLVCDKQFKHKTRLQFINHVGICTQEHFQSDEMDLENDNAEPIQSEQQGSSLELVTENPGLVETPATSDLQDNSMDLGNENSEIVENRHGDAPAAVNSSTINKSTDKSRGTGDAPAAANSSTIISTTDKSGDTGDAQVDKSKKTSGKNTGAVAKPSNIDNTPYKKQLDKSTKSGHVSADNPSNIANSTNKSLDTRGAPAPIPSKIANSTDKSLDTRGARAPKPSNIANSTDKSLDTRGAPAPKPSNIANSTDKSRGIGHAPAANPSNIASSTAKSRDIGRAPAANHSDIGNPPDKKQADESKKTSRTGPFHRHLKSPEQMKSSGTVPSPVSANVKPSNIGHLKSPEQMKSSGTVPSPVSANVKPSNIGHLKSPEQMKSSGTVPSPVSANVKPSNIGHLKSPEQMKSSGTVPSPVSANVKPKVTTYTVYAVENDKLRAVPNTQTNKPGCSGQSKPTPSKVCNETLKPGGPVIPKSSPKIVPESPQRNVESFKKLAEIKEKKTNPLVTQSLAGFLEPNHPNALELNRSSKVPVTSNNSASISAKPTQKTSVSPIGKNKVNQPITNTKQQSSSHGSPSPSTNSKSVKLPNANAISYSENSLIKFPEKTQFTSETELIAPSSQISYSPVALPVPVRGGSASKSKNKPSSSKNNDVGKPECPKRVYPSTSQKPKPNILRKSGTMNLELNKAPALTPHVSNHTNQNDEDSDGESPYPPIRINQDIFETDTYSQGSSNGKTDNGAVNESLAHPAGQNNETNSVRVNVIPIVVSVNVPSLPNPISQLPVTNDVNDEGHFDKLCETCGSTFDEKHDYEDHYCVDPKSDD